MGVITGTRYDGVAVMLCDEYGAPIQHGQEMETFRGEPIVVTGGTPPHKRSSTGRVMVEYANRRGPWSAQEFFPSVIGAAWEPINEEPN